MMKTWTRNISANRSDTLSRRARKDERELRDGRPLHVKRQTSKFAARHHGGGQQAKPVVSDQGDTFTSISAATRAMYLADASTIRRAVRLGTTAAGKHWRAA